MSDKDDGWSEVTADTTGETWNREKPIEGRLTNVRSGVGANESMLYTVKTKEGVVVVWGSTVLDTKFSEIETGSDVRIEPQGEVKSEKTGRKYQDFKVFVKPPVYKEVGGEPLPIAPEDIPF